MDAYYEGAKRVALGLEREQVAQTGDDLWSVSLGGDFRFSSEMPFQFFERGFEPPDEQTAQKSALMLLYGEEYAEDRKAAEKRLEELKRALAQPAADGVRRCMEEAPPEEWLSLIFLDGDRLREELVPLLDSAGSECKAVVAAALDGALARLVDFKDLLEVLRQHC